MSDEYQPRLISVFISAGLRDIQAECDYLQKFTLPRLRELCASRGVSVKVVELSTGKDTTPEDVLQLTLEALQRSRPYYIGLIGEDYGRVVRQIPDELLSGWPLLAQYHGRSTSELEIVCGVLRDEAMYGRGFFYFRDPKFIDKKAHAVTEEQVQNSSVLRKLDDLKQSIRAASQQGICRLRENYRNVEELGGWIIDDFSQLIDDLWPAFEAQAEIEPYDDDVLFTVYRPETLVPQKWYSLLAFAHLSERRPDAPEDEPDPIAEVHRQARQILGEKMPQYRKSSQDSGSLIPHAGEITFKPFMPGVDFNPSSRSFRWEEPVHREEFKMRATTAPDGEIAKGWLRVYLGPLLLAQINLSVRVDSKFVSHSRKQAPAVGSARPLRKVFASYSHKDRAIVEHIEEIVKQTYLGIEYLRDATKLRAGEVWSPKLMEMIREANAFQLFWSTNSMGSEFVRQEYQYALTLAREDFILPVYWETPFPEKPEDGLPPEELRRLHFEKLAKSIAALGRSARARKRKASRVSPADITNEFVTCPHCGGVANRAHKYCKHCGAKNPSDSYAEMSPPAVTATLTPIIESGGLSLAPRKSKKSNAGPALALIGAVMLTAGIMLGLFTQFSSPSVTTISTDANSITGFETGRVEGSVRDLSGRPVAYATVSIRNGPATKTDQNGYFVLQYVSVGVQLIQIETPSSKVTTQSVRVGPNETASVGLIYDSGASQLGLLSITDPANGTSLRVDRVGDTLLTTVNGRYDGLTELLGNFDVWVLIRPEYDSQFWLHRPPAVIDRNSHTWQARIEFGATGTPHDQRWDIVAIAVRSPSELEYLLSTPTFNKLPTHVTSNVVTVVTTDR